MAQYIFTMNRVSKVVRPKREILKDISLSFFPGAKIGVLGLNGAGKSSLLRIMAGADKEHDGEARPQPGIRVGFLPQEPVLDPDKDVRGNVEEALSHITGAQADHLQLPGLASYLVTTIGRLQTHFLDKGFRILVRPLRDEIDHTTNGCRDITATGNVLIRLSQCFLKAAGGFGGACCRLCGF